MCGNGWLFIGNDGYLHMYSVLVNNTVGNEIMPLVKNGMVQFSTEGYTEDYDSGFWITAVAAVGTGNDPSTQITQNSAKEKIQMEKNELSALLDEKLATLKINAADPTTLQSVLAKITALSKLQGFSDDEILAQIDAVVDSALKALNIPDVDDDTSDDDSEDDQDDTTQMAGQAQNKAKGANMSKNTVVQPIVTNEVENLEDQKVTNKVKNIIKSEAYAADFLRAIISAGGSNEKAINNVQSLLKKNAITIDAGGSDIGDFYPEILITRMEQYIRTKGALWASVTKSGLTKLIAGVVTSTTTSQGRARGNAAEKERQAINAILKLVQPEQLYKFFTLSDQEVFNNGGLSNSALINFVVDELTQHVIMGLEKAILVGGVMDDSATPAAWTSFNSINDLITASGSPFNTGFVYATGSSLPENLDMAAATVRSAKGAPVVITARTNVPKFKYAVTSNGYPIYTQVMGQDNQMIEMLNGYQLITPEWLLDADQAANASKVWVGDIASYTTVGEQAPTSLYAYYLRTNEHDFEAKITAGGSLTTPKSFAVFSIPTPA